MIGLIIFLNLFISMLCVSQSKNNTEAKAVIENYITAFNTGEDAMRVWIQDNISETALKNRPIDSRLSVYRRMLEDMGMISMNKLEVNGPSLTSAIIKTAKGEWFQFTFEFAPDQENKVVGIRVEDTEEPAQADEPKIKEISGLQQIAKYLGEQDKTDVFSGSVLISKNGKKVFQKAYGMASKEFKVLNNIETKFNLGSINKIFTQIAIGQLFEESKLQLDEPIIKYIPNYPNQTVAQKVSIRHLLNMTSGVGDFFGEKFEQTPKDKFRTLNDFLQMFVNDSLSFEPGSNNRYSNGGYIILGLIIEKISGQSYYDYVKEKIFKPAGMSNSDYYEADMPVQNLAEGYTREEQNQPWKKNIYSRPARGSSAGGGYSTADDLLKFTIALKKNLFFKNDNTWNILRGEPTNSNVSQQKGIGIFGGAPGINSGVETEVGNGYTVIIMTNYDPPTALDAMKKIRGILKRVK